MAPMMCSAILLLTSSSVALSHNLVNRPALSFLQEVAGSSSASVFSLEAADDTTAFSGENIGAKYGIPSLPTSEAALEKLLDEPLSASDAEPQTVAADALVTRSALSQKSSPWRPSIAMRGSPAGPPERTAPAMQRRDQATLETSNVQFAQELQKIAKIQSNKATLETSNVQFAQERPLNLRAGYIPQEAQPVVAKTPSLHSYLRSASKRRQGAAARKRVAGAAAGTGKHTRSKSKGVGLTRPGVGSGKADIINFGAFAKAFYGASLKNNNFVIDSIVALKWTDPRVISSVPAGLEKYTMSGKQAMSTIWMPEIVVTNRDIRKKEVISTSVTIHTTGEVFKVERAVLVINNIYDLEQYPFDEQFFRVKFASSKYMLDSVALAPFPEQAQSGVDEKLFEAFPYKLLDWKVYSFEEVDGALKKSRGVFEMKVEREMEKYGENHLMPASLLIIISWGVFWFPFDKPFITPRLALSILVLLSFTNIMVKSGDEIPDGAPCNWNDVFNQNVQALMFCTIILNILSEIYMHQFKVEDMARAVNHEAKIVQPILSFVVIGIILTGGKYKWISLFWAGLVCKTLIVIAMLSYVGHRHNSAVAAKDAKAAKEKQEQEAERMRIEAERIKMEERQQLRGGPGVSGAEVAGGERLAEAAADAAGDGGDAG